MKDFIVSAVFLHHYFSKQIMCGCDKDEMCVCVSASPPKNNNKGSDDGDGELRDDACVSCDVVSSSFHQTSHAKSITHFTL